MGNGDKAASLGAQNVARASHPQHQKILQACKHRADQYIEGLFIQVADKLDDKLINLSNKGDGEPDAGGYMEAARELHVKRKDIAHAFVDGFTRNYKARLSQAALSALPSNKGHVQSGGLSLVDEHELEESLAIDGLVARAKDRLRNELYALAQRYNLLVDGAAFDDESQPLGPETISYAFRDVFQGMALKVEIKLIAYKLFEQSVMQSLGEFYHQLNTLLSEAGILPELKLSLPIRSPGGDTQARSPGPKANQSPEVPLNNSPEAMRGGSSSSGDIYQTLQQLMNVRKYGDTSTSALAEGLSSGGHSGGGAVGAGMITGSALPTDDLVRGLSLLQHDPLPAESGGAINIAAIKGALLGQMKQLGDTRGIHPAHDNTIDVIGMIFEFILDEPSIPDVVKTLLNQLQIPIIKVAIVDKKFFTDKSHPARRLLNVLGHAGIGWNDNVEEVRQRRFQKMEYVVNRVLTEYEQDPSIFASLLDEFSEFLAREGLGADTEQVIPRVEQTQEAPSDKLAFELVEARLEGAEVPEVLRDFMRNIWRNVLQHALEQEGHDGEAWRRCEKTVDDLIWSVEPKATADDRRRMMILLPRLLDALREGMTLIGRSQQEMDAAIDALEPMHMACLRGEAPAMNGGRNEQAQKKSYTSEVSSGDVTDMIRSIQEGMRRSVGPETANGDDSMNDDIFDLEKGKIGMESPLEQEDLAQPGSDLSDMEDEFSSAAAEMKLGTWLEFSLDDKKRRAKLAWKSVVMGEYVFVDRKYKVVAERTLAELAADLRHGRAALVEDVAMFDRALDKVLNGLMTSGRATH